MAAALPYVDAFVEGHSVAAMEELAATISAMRTEPRPERPPHLQTTVAVTPRPTEGDMANARAAR